MGVMAKPKKLGTLKKEAWDSVSRVVRYAFAEDGIYCSCVTCGNPLKWDGGAQCGHWIPRAQGLGIYFELDNLAPQCYRCNINLGSNGPEYARWMEENRGRGVMELLREKQQKGNKFTKQDYIDMKKHYDSEFDRIHQLRMDGAQGILDVVPW